MSVPPTVSLAEVMIAISSLRALVDELDRRVAILETDAAAARVNVAKTLGAAGGKARAAAMTIDERKHAAKRAVEARWKKTKGT